jgi:hypothetical protein
MKSATLKRFWDCFDALPPNIQQLAREAFATWQRDPRHPSLHFKKVHPSEPLYSVRIGDRWRALGYRKDDTMVWFWIGSHADYDKAIRRF